MKARIVLATLLALAASLLTGRPTASVETQRTDSWQIACVDCPHWIDELTDRSLSVDGAGNLHLAYGGDHLYYAWRDGEVWQVQTADDAPAVGSSASLALDDSGQPAIAYYDSVNQDLKFARRDGAVWTAETVDTGGDGGTVGFDTRLAMDAAGTFHIVYSDSVNGSLKYAYGGPGGWQVETVDKADFQELLLSLAVSSTGVPHICYIDHAQDALIHGERSSSGWILETVIADDGTSCSLALDADDHPHIAYNSYIGQGESGIAHWTGTSWQFEQLSWHWGSPRGLSLTISDAGFFHVAATVWVRDSSGYPRLQYFYQDTAGWHLLLDLDDDGVRLGQTTIAVDTGGHTFIGFPTNSGLSLTTLNDNGWNTEAVDTRDDVGSLSSLAIDGAGRPIVAYAGQGSSMTVASWADQSWTIEANFPSSRSEQRAGFSLILDDAWQPHVIHAWEYRYADLGYYHNLTYRYRDANGWQSQAIAEDTSQGPFLRPSIALDTAGSVHISYTLRNQGLILRSASGTLEDWTLEQVDSGGDLLGALLLAENGDPIFGYEAYIDLVKVAFRDATGWHYEMADTVGGSGVSMILDDGGYPRISYGAYDGRLAFAFRDDTGWHQETVLAGEFDDTSLVLDDAGYAHLSAYNAGTGDLVYAYQTAAGWQTQTIDTGGPSGNVGRGSSLALSVDGWVYITYYDEHNRDLLIATNRPPTAVTLAQLQASSAASTDHGWLLGLTALLCLLLGRWIAALAGWRLKHR